MLPQFIPAHAAHLLMGLALAGIHDAEGLIWFTALISAVHLARRFLDSSRTHKIIDRITGTVLIGFGLAVLVVFDVEAGHRLVHGFEDLGLVLGEQVPVDVLRGLRLRVATLNQQLCARRNRVSGLKDTRWTTNFTLRALHSGRAQTSIRSRALRALE